MAQMNLASINQTDDNFDFLFKVVIIGDCGTGKCLEVLKNQQLHTFPNSFKGKTAIVSRFKVSLVGV